jgi:hypothetical protein
MQRWPFKHLLSACLLSCDRVAASRMQIVPEWPPDACKVYPSGRQLHGNFSLFYFMLLATGGQSGTICMRLAAIRVKFACDWRPGHSGTIYMRLAASRMQILHGLAASFVQSHQFFASTLREQLFELKNEDAIKKSENLRDICAC